MTKKRRNAEEWSHIVDQINQLKETGMTAKEAAKRLGVSVDSYYQKLSAQTVGKKLGRPAKWSL